jgi:DNA-directed RNA polymerase sigma subunit (sigma70/sigma32)
VILAANENTRGSTVRSTRSEDGQVQLLRKTQQYLKGMSEEPVTTEQVASQLNVTVDRVHVLKRMARPVVSAENLFASETIADSSLPLFSRMITEGSREEAIERCMSRLDPEERFVLAHRMGLIDGAPKSWEELQRLMDGCGVSYLKKVEMRAKAHLMRDREFSTLMLRGTPQSVFSTV